MEEKPTEKSEKSENSEKLTLKDAIKLAFSKKIFDVLFIIAIMAASVLLRGFSLNLHNIPEGYQDSFRDDTTDLPYMSDPDSYHYALRTRVILETGNYSLFTPESEMPYRVNRHVKEGDKTNNFFPIMMALIYRGVNSVINLDFDTFITAIVPFIYAISVIPAYIFVYRRTHSRLGAIVAGFFAGISIAFIGKTAFACFDTDVLLFFLPCTLMCFYIEALLAKKKTNTAIYILLATLTMGILAYAWGAYAPYYYLSIAVTLALIFFRFLKTRDLASSIKNRETLVSFITVICFTVAILILKGSIDTGIFGTIADIIAGSASTATSTGWPSAGQFVSELQSLPLISGTIFSVNSNGTINVFGGIFAFLATIASLGVIIAIFFISDTYHEAWETPSSESEEDNTYLVLISTLAVWAIGGLVSLMGGNRFSEIAAIPATLILGLGVGFASTKLLEKELGITAALLFVAVIIIPLLNIIGGSVVSVPTITDATVDVSKYIAEDAEGRGNPIIFSWWDYGYAYQYYSGLRSYADGGTYDGEVYTFLAQMLMTSDPDESAAAIEHLLDLAGEKPEYIYLIISQDMAQITGALSYYANWIAPEGTEYAYEGSLIEQSLTKEGNLGRYRYLASFADPTNSHGSRLYRLHLHYDED